MLGSASTTRPRCTRCSVEGDWRVQGKAAKRRRWRSKRAAFEAAARLADPAGAANRNAATVAAAPLPGSKGGALGGCGQSPPPPTGGLQKQTAQRRGVGRGPSFVPSRKRPNQPTPPNPAHKEAGGRPGLLLLHVPTSAHEISSPPAPSIATAQPHTKPTRPPSRGPLLRGGKEESYAG